MKNKKTFLKGIFTAAFLTIIAMSFNTCSDPSAEDKLPDDPPVTGSDVFRMIWQGAFENAPANPQEVWVYYNKTDNKVWVFFDNAWHRFAQDGLPGSVPQIGANGNWWIDGVDTGKPAIGTDGSDGNPGTPGSVVTIVGGYWFINGVTLLQ